MTIMDWKTCEGCVSKPCQKKFVHGSCGRLRAEAEARIIDLEAKNGHLQAVIELAKEALKSGWNPIWELETEMPSRDESDKQEDGK